MSSSLPPRDASTSPLPVDTGPASLEQVAARARALALDAHDGVPAPPFDPERIAASLGIPVCHQPLPEGMDALLVPRGDRFRIVVNTRVRNRARVRFSIAHELAHTLFEGATAKLQRRTAAARHHLEDDPVLERLCDRGAAEMLMPEGAVRRVLAGAAFPADGVVELSAGFQVSLEAACLRFLEVAAPEVQAVGIFEYAVRPSSRDRAAAGLDFEIPAYRVRRVFSRSGFPYLFPRGKSVPAHSAIVRSSWGPSCRGVERFGAGERELELRVAACRVPASAGSDPGGPPVVVATFG